MTTFHMPGSFHNEASHPAIFRPPTSPSGSGYISNHNPNPSSSTRPTPSYDTASKRKRKVADRDEPMTAGSIFAGRGLSDGNSRALAGRRFSEGKYALAGQISAPGAVTSDSEILGESAHSESDFRRALGPNRVRDDDDMDTGTLGSTPLFNFPTEPTPTRGWGSAALGTLGGVVGKLWEFCTTNAFKGFYAGGGSGFQVNSAGAVQEVHVTINGSMFTEEGHRFPGCYPDADAPAAQIEEEAYDFESRASTPVGPSAKRRQTENKDDLGRNWVMVKEPRRSTPKRYSTPSKPASRNRNQGPSLATRRRIETPQGRASIGTASPTPRRSTASRQSFVEMPPSQPHFTSQASYASSRSPSPSKHSASLSQPSGFQPGHSRRRSNVVNSPSTPTLSHRRTTSNASTASPRPSTMNTRPSTLTQSSRTSTSHSRTSSFMPRASLAGNPVAEEAVDHSPRLDAEAKKLAAKRHRQEKKHDVQMDDFNQRLQDMIRQGKEALGTRIDVDEDEAWDEE